MSDLRQRNIMQREWTLHEAYVLILPSPLSIGSSNEHPSPPPKPWLRPRAMPAVLRRLVGMGRGAEGGVGRSAAVGAHRRPASAVRPSAAGRPRAGASPGADLKAALVEALAPIISKIEVLETKFNREEAG